MTEWLCKIFVKDYTNTEDPAVRLAYGRMTSIVGIICNVLLCSAKALIGFAAGSVAIVADAVNNLSDAIGNIVSLVGFKLASRPADPGHPYGHGRYEYLAGLVVSVLVCAVGIELIQTGYERIVSPQDVELSVELVVVLAFSSVLKFWMSRFTGTVGRRIDSDALKANSVDSRNDVITTLAVLACTVIAYFTGVDLDGWASLAIGIMVIVSGLQLVKEVVDQLVGQAPDAQTVDHITQKLLSFPGVQGVHRLMVHEYGPSRRFAMANVEMAAEPSLLESHELVDAIERSFLEDEGIVLTVHCSPVITDDPAVAELVAYIQTQASQLADGVAARNIRRIPGAGRFNAVFDLIRPEKCAYGADWLRDAMVEKIRERYPEAVCTIRVVEVKTVSQTLVG